MGNHGQGCCVEEAGQVTSRNLEGTLRRVRDSTGKVAHQIPEVKNYNGDMERPPDIGRSELRVSNETRVWNGERQVKLSDLAVGDVALAIPSGELPGAPSRCTDLSIGADTHKLVTERQSRKLAPTKK